DAVRAGSQIRLAERKARHDAAFAHLRERHGGPLPPEAPHPRHGVHFPPGRGVRHHQARPRWEEPLQRLTDRPRFRRPVLVREAEAASQELFPKHPFPLPHGHPPPPPPPGPASSSWYSSGERKGASARASASSKKRCRLTSPRVR